MFEDINALHEFLTELLEALSTTRITQTKNLTVEQKMFGQLEKIVVGDNSSVTINQNIILAVEARGLLKRSILLLDRLKNVVPSRELPLPESISTYKEKMILYALEETDGDIRKAAELLGMSYRQFRYNFNTKGIRKTWENRQRRMIENG